MFLEYLLFCSGCSHTYAASIITLSSLRPWPLEALPCVVGVLSGSGLYQLSLFTVLRGRSKLMGGFQYNLFLLDFCSALPSVLFCMLQAVKIYGSFLCCYSQNVILLCF